MTWVLVVWCVLILAWAIAGGASADNSATTKCLREHILSAQACHELSDAGTGLGVAVVLLIGFVGFVFFSLIWLMTRPKSRTCPVCGENVKRGSTTCEGCGHDFAAAATPATA